MHLSFTINGRRKLKKYKNTHRPILSHFDENYNMEDVKSPPARTHIYFRTCPPLRLQDDVGRPLNYGDISITVQDFENPPFPPLPSSPVPPLRSHPIPPPPLPSLPLEV